MRKIKWVASLCLAAAVAGCGAPKGEVSEDFSELATLDDKSDAFSWRMQIVGSLSYGETSATVKYRNPPRFRAFKFAGQPGDQIDVTVRSTNGGDAVAWVLNNAFEVLGKNDDSNGTLNSNIQLTLPGNANPAIVTYYVVFRDYWLQNRSFKVELKGTPANDFYSCNFDADCVMVPTGCCPHLGFTSVRAGQEDAYRANLGCQDPQICPAIAIRPEFRVPQCNNDSKKCELIAPRDIACGGRVAGGNAHQCPDNWTCYGQNRLVDGTDQCVPNCGGFAGTQCSDPNTTCQDNPYDDCDPANGGADCGGICIAPPAPPTDCRTTGCGTGEYCTFCWINYACIPNGAVC